MKVSENIKATEIDPNKIKGNIYDYVELIVDFHGIRKYDIENIQRKLTDLLPADSYSMAEDSFGEEEINAYGARRNLSSSARRRYYENETVIRYYSKDNTECVTISRLFVSIRLSYEIAHDLKKNMELLNKIVCLLAEEEYFEIEEIYLVKKDSIYCSSLHNVYQCFNAGMFGDSGYLLALDSMAEIEHNSTEIRNSFLYGKYEAEVKKTVRGGSIPDSDQTIYEAAMTTTVMYEAEEEVVNVLEILNDLNRISFDIFIRHITDSFAEDLVNGCSEKVERGLNCYGQKSCKQKGCESKKCIDNAEP